MKLTEKLRQVLISHIYKVSNCPVLYKDLLRANLLYNEGMYVDPGILNFRKNLFRAYLDYGIICFIIITPILLLTHTLFTRIDFHISIIGTIVITSCVFMGFSVFNVWIRRAITKKLIQEAWKNHFPYFPYEKYSQKVEALYAKALKEEVVKKDLEEYIMNGLIEEKINL